MPKREPVKSDRPPYPTTIRVGAMDYTVKPWDPRAAHNTGALGMCDRCSNTILLMTGMVPQKEAEVLLHEVVHAAYDGSGLNTNHERSEEQIVNVLGYMWLQLIRDNPALMEYLQAVFDEE